MSTPSDPPLLANEAITPLQPQTSDEPSLPRSIPNEPLTIRLVSPKVEPKISTNQPASAVVGPAISEIGSVSAPLLLHSENAVPLPKEKILELESTAPPALTPQLRQSSRQPLVPWTESEQGFNNQQFGQQPPALAQGLANGPVFPLKVNLSQKPRISDLVSEGHAHPMSEMQFSRNSQRTSPLTPMKPMSGSMESAPPVAPESNVNQPQVKSNIDFNHAVSFVKRIKSRFSSEPEVYSSFLEILHTFQRDQPSVTQVYSQVSRLFHNHPDLLEEFARFLPPPAEPANSSKILRPGPKTGVFHAGPSQPPPARSMEGEKSPIFIVDPIKEDLLKDLKLKVADNQIYEEIKSCMNLFSINRIALPDLISIIRRRLHSYPELYARFKDFYGWKEPNVPKPTPSPKLQPLPPPAPPTATQAAVQLQPQKNTAEFKHAVNYVKKIKTRFINEPEVYSSFLEVLHTYQKEHSSVQQVYAQISRLFKNHPDLLEEFSEFLPDPNANASQSSLQMRQNSSNMNAAISAVNSSNLAQQTRFMTQKAEEPRKYPPPRTAKNHAALSLPSAKRIKTGNESDDQGIQQSPEEIEFFEKVKKFLNNKQIYAEFLKCLNLFSQDVLRVQDLIHLVQGFLGNSPELFNWFKQYVNYKELPSLSKKEGKEGKDAVQLDLSSCKRYGSYRALPKSYQRAPCSGRTPLCIEVLNDSFVSCPSFNSEDSTFLSSKKNQYEDALFRCEDERYELDLLIDGNQAAIQVFEPISQKLQMMGPEEADNFTLGSNLGGTSEVIYHKAIKKVYGDKASEVIEGLKKNPAITVPVVLRRLKQKDEEWRKHQREWNKIWREVHIKNYYKALDHQGINFKNSDKKTVSSKALISEIETLLLEARKAKKTTHQQEFSFKDSKVLVDCHCLVMNYIRKTNSLNSSDKSSISKFVNNFLPEFMNYKKMSDCEDLYEDDSDRGGIEASVILFANNQLYVLFRLFQIIYARVEQMKMLSAEVGEEKKNMIAISLDLVKNEGNLNNDQDSVYNQTLDLIDKFLEGNVDYSIFEEKLRFVFKISAYNIFTIDKIIQAFVKQIMSILTDTNCENLIRLFDSSLHVKGKYLTEYSIKLAAESILKDENLYRLEYLKSEKTLTIQLIDKQIDNHFNSIEEKWSNYVDNFVKIDCDYSLLSNRPLLFLKRNLKADLSDVSILYNLECKICVNTYKMFFVENSEDFLYRRPTRTFGNTWHPIKSSKLSDLCKLTNTDSFDSELKKWFMDFCTKQEEFDLKGKVLHKYVTDAARKIEKKK